MSSAIKNSKKVAKPVEVKVEAVKVEAVKTKAAPAKKEKAVAAAPVAAPVAEKKPRTRKPKEEVVKEVVEEKEEVKRGPATKESVTQDVLDLIASLSTAKVGELENMKQSVKLLRSTASKLKHLRNDLTRVLKKTVRSTVPKDKSKMSNSGLMKPVVISKDLATFMKVPIDSLHSRVSVTNAICTYIKEHNLQNPSNKREINPDAELARILNFKAGGSPLTYFYIQQLIQPHFLKEISSDLAKFMKVSETSLQSSSSVANALNAYVTSKGLINGTTVQPDEALGKLLGKSTPMTVLAMNQLAKNHFKK
jgi:upstream activation factor subunit UAF30